MTEAANSPDPLPQDDDTAWPEDAATGKPQEPARDADPASIIEENTSVNGSPD